MIKMSNLLTKAREEIQLCGRFRHPNVATSFMAFDSTESDKEGKIYLLMQCGDLASIASSKQTGDDCEFSLN
jgi:hypothetical protein